MVHQSISKRPGPSNRGAAVRLVLGRGGLALGFALGVILCFAGTAAAGGGGFAPDEDEADAGPRFFGFVKDTDNNVIDDVKITVKVKKLNITLVLRTDSQGHFRVRGFPKGIDPAEIDISCGKEGYREVDPPRRLPPSGAGAATEVDCTLEHN